MVQKGWHRNGSTKAYIFPNLYIPGGLLGKVEILGSRASSRTMVPSMLDWLQ